MRIARWRVHQRGSVRRPSAKDVDCEVDQRSGLVNHGSIEERERFVQQFNRIFDQLPRVDCIQLIFRQLDLARLHVWGERDTELIACCNMQQLGLL